MNDSRRTKAWLLEELARLRSEIASLKGHGGHDPCPAPPPAGLAEEVLRQSESNYRAVFNSVNDILFVHDIETGDAVDFNQRASEVFGFGPGEIDLLNAHFRREADPPYSYEDQMRWLRKTAEGPPQVFEWLAGDRNGRRFWVEVSVRRATIGARDRLLAVLRDIGDRKQAEEALRRSEEQHRLLFEQSVDGIIVGGVGGCIVSANPAMCRILGRPPNEIVGSNVLSHIHPDDLPIARKRADVLKSAAAPLPGQVYRLVRPDGAPVWVEMRSQRLQWEGRPGFLIIVRDITERRQAEEALRASEARYRAVVEFQTELICRFTEGGTLTFVNEAYCRYFGKRREELIGVSFLPMIPEADRASVRERLASIRRDHAVVTHEHRAVLPSGEIRWMHWTNHGLFDDQGRLVECQAIGRDITERRQTEEALRSSEARYRAIVEDQTEMITRFTPDGRATFVNEALCRFFGKPRDQILGHAFMPHVHPDDVPLVEAAIGSLTPEHPVETHENRNLMPSGEVRWMQWTNRGIFDAQGRMVEVQAVGRDVTERVRLEEELAEALKMEAVGQLAGGIAHDFNNLMTGILCHAGLLKDNPGPAEDVREAAGLIEGAARRAAELTSRLLGFARRGKLQDVPVDLNAAVETTVSLLRRSLDSRIRVRTCFQADRAVVRGDPVQMEQVVLNLAFNARDAMPEGGDMVFTTEVRDLTEAEGAGHPRAAPGPHVVLAVQDTGCGIPDEIRDRIFEPFFTTKPRGRGTGMGLAMVYGIARNHGGWVDVDTAVGRGSTFRVFLPEAHEEAPDAEPAAEAPPSARAGVPATGPGRILVVDDEALVRNVVDRMLTGLGYKVVTADDGRQAAELYRRFHRDIDLVIVDMVMPEMDGRECFRALRGIDPAVRVILSTGQAGEGTIQDVLDEGMVGFVQKPYQAAQLAEAVRRALGSV